MLTTRVVAQLTPAKERLVHPLEDSWCRINFVCGKKSSGLKSDEQGAQTTSLPCPVHCTGHVSIRKLRTMVGKCAGTLSSINHMCLWKGSGTDCN